VHMCTPDRTEWNTDQAKQLNGAHYKFMCCGTESENGDAPETISLEEYVEKIISYLSGDDSDQDVLAFIHTISHKLETGRFCPLDSKDRFAKCLSRAWHSYRKQHGLAPTIVRQKRVGPSEEAYSALIPARATAASIQAALCNLRDGIELSEHVLYRLLTKLSKGIAYGELQESPRCIEPIDDLAQVGVTHVWNKLPTFKGIPEQFYSWAKKVGRRAIKTAIINGCVLTDNCIPFAVLSDDGEEHEANPDIFSDYHPQHQRELPEFIQGIDLKICMYIRADKTYSQIADLLEMSEGAVKKRVAEMRRKIQEMKSLQTVQSAG